MIETLDSEKTILKYYRKMSRDTIKYFGSFWRCFRIDRLTRSFLFRKGWKDNSGKGDLPPDFVNYRHKIMMEIMKIDDCVGELNGKHIMNSFEITNTQVKSQLGKDYKNRLNGVLCFIPDTSNTEQFNYYGYFKNFEKVLMSHGRKIADYRKNHPKCSQTIFLINDESNNYVQVTKKSDIERVNSGNNKSLVWYPHHWFLDNRFLKVIKQCGADFVIWIGYYKLLIANGKKVRQPRICIFDVNNFNGKGFIYNDELMVPVHNEELPK